MGLSLGNKNIGSIYKGDKSIGKIYLGDKLIFQKSVPMVLVTNLYSFTSVGSTTFTIPANTESIDYLVVAGGGGGGNSDLSSPSGGGGAGGVLQGTILNPISNDIYSVVVGAGGAGGVRINSSRGQNGGDSKFGNIIATGGGGGGGRYDNNGGSGGSGGGAYTGVTNGSGGSGISGQGYPGNAWVNSSTRGGGGGSSSGMARSDGYRIFGLRLDFTGTLLYYGTGGSSGAFGNLADGENGFGGGGDGNTYSQSGYKGGSGCVHIKVTHWIPA